MISILLQVSTKTKKSSSYTPVVSTRVLPVQYKGSTRSYTNFHFILIIKLMLLFCMGQMNYCTGIPQATGMFSWGSASAKRLKTTDIPYSIELDTSDTISSKKQFFSLQ